jgi:hypothetical protein
MIATLALLGVALTTQSTSSALAWTSVICVAAYVACFAISLGPIFWLMIAEIYPLKVRSLAMSVGAAANWGSNFIVAFTFLPLLKALGASTFWLYALIGVIALVFVLRLVPETKGKTLEEIEASWRSRGKAA